MDYILSFSKDISLSAERFKNTI